MGIGAVIEGQRDDVVMDQAGMENGARLEQRHLRVPGAIRRHGRRQRQQHPQNESESFHGNPITTPESNLPSNARAASRPVVKKPG
jgi:hypothetical protein